MLSQYHNILVAVDGSKEAEMAYNKAVAVAKRNDATLHILNVIDTRAFQNISSFDTSMVESVSEDANKKLADYTESAKKNGVTNVESKIEFGSPKTIIAKDYPEKHDIDLIIIGATGLNAVERLLIGSVTEFVTRTAKTDVLVIRTPLSE